jgi:predicted Rossmann fold nucleotide-binding protein DprA/Smf involved in DNA uptake
VKIAIVGSRHYPDLDGVETYILSLPSDTTLVTGSASGVDAAVTRAARKLDLAVQKFPASFEENSDPSMAAERNRKLVDEVDTLVAFWDGASSGTRLTVDRALDSGKEVHVFVSPSQPS